MFNREGLVWLGKRNFYPSHKKTKTHQWQLPQGGIEKKETPQKAALRELHEETGIGAHLVQFLAQTPWLTYTIPRPFGSTYKGQRQKWFAMRFLGDDHHINTSMVDPPEFVAWRWEKLEKITQLVIPFKRDVYTQVTRAFKNFGRL